jgi:hypothetical protein
MLGKFRSRRRFSTHRCLGLEKGGNEEPLIKRNLQIMSVSIYQGPTRRRAWPVSSQGTREFNGSSNVFDGITKATSNHTSLIRKNMVSIKVVQYTREPYL